MKDLPLPIDKPNLKQRPTCELSTFLTPLPTVFFVCHTGIPKVDPANWRLSITGMVESEVHLSLQDIAAMPQVEVMAFHECCGNPWEPTQPVRRVSNVVWGGVRLYDVLKQAGIKTDALFLWSHGADTGDYYDIKNPGYVKDLPIAEIYRNEVILATHMNGETLPERHGGPLRLIVPGYYGTNSTKWLVQLEVRDTRSPGYFTTVMYNDRIMKDGIETIKPLWRIAPNSIIVSPAAEDRPPCATQVISGWTWGADTIVQLEVSTDDGASWQKAILDEREDRSWQRFEFEWTPPCPGRYQLRCRATDCTGLSQPDAGVRNATFLTEVTVD